MRVVRLLSCAALLAVAPSASASLAYPTAPTTVKASNTGAAPIRERPSRWYGWQTAALDAAALGLAVTFLEVGRANGDVGSYPGFAYMAGAIFLLGGPAVHLAHEQPWRAAGSLLLRAALPAVTSAIGCNTSTRREDTGCQEGLLTGFMVGLGAAAVIDAAFLAHRTTAAPSADGAPRAAVFTPSIAVARDSFGVGFASAF